MKKNFSRLAIALLVVVVAMTAVPPAAEAEPAAPAEVSALACVFIGDLEDLLDEYDLRSEASPPTWLDFNLRKARVATVQALDRANNGNLRGSVSKLVLAQVYLERASVVPVSGTGFADDLASLSDFRSQTFVDGLIGLAEEFDLVSNTRITSARSQWDEGVALGDVDEWQEAMRKFRKATALIDRRVTITPSC